MAATAATHGWILIEVLAVVGEGGVTEGVILGGVREPLLLGHELETVGVARCELAQHEAGDRDDDHGDNGEDHIAIHVSASVRSPTKSGAP